MATRRRLSIVDIQTIVQERVKACAVCGGTAWELEPDLFGLRLNNPWVPREGKTVECAVLTCHDCGNTHFLNAEVLAKGLSLPIPEEDSGLPDDEEPPA